MLLFAFPIVITSIKKRMRLNNKSKGGRPSKPTEEKRCRVVTVKLTDAEYSDLYSRAKMAGVKIAEFIRHGAFRLTIVSRLTEEEKELAQGIVRMSPDFNQAITWLHALKTIRAAQKLLSVIDAMYEILKKLRPNKEIAYVCKNT